MRMQHGFEMDPDFHGPQADCRALLAVIEGDLSAYMDRDLDRQRGIS